MASESFSHRLPLRFLQIAMGAALLGALADVLLLYNPQGGYEAGNYLFLQDIGSQRLLWGHYIGILIIPLEALGLWFIYEGIKPAGKNIGLAVLVIGVYVIFPGVAYHTTVIFTAHFLKLKQELPEESSAHLQELIPLWKSFSEPLAAVLFTGFAVASLLLVWVLVQKRTDFAKWLAWWNPLTFYAVFLILYLVLPAVGTLLVPAGFNLAFFLFFVCAKKARLYQSSV